MNHFVKQRIDGVGKWTILQEWTTKPDYVHCALSALLDENDPAVLFILLLHSIVTAACNLE